MESSWGRKDVELEGRRGGGGGGGQDGRCPLGSVTDAPRINFLRMSGHTV